MLTYLVMVLTELAMMLTIGRDVNVMATHGIIMATHVNFIAIRVYINIVT